VFREIFFADRLERPRTDVQREVGELDAARGERGEERLVEVQARGRRGDGARGARVHVW